MPTSNPKYKSLDDILSALKDEDQPTEELAAKADDLPKKFPKESASETIAIEKNVESDEPITEQRTMNNEHPSTKEISEIADQLDGEEVKSPKKSKKDEQEQGEDEVEEEDKEIEEVNDPAKEVADPETTNNDPSADGRTLNTDTPKPTWRTSPANLKSSKPETSHEPPETSNDDEGSSLPESMRDERPNFDVPSPVSGATPKPAAEQRWADFPEYPTTENSEPSKTSLAEGGADETAEPRAYESNLTDIVENDRQTSTSDLPDGFPIRRIDHSAHNRFGLRQQEARSARLGNSIESRTFEDDSSIGSAKGRSFDYNLDSGKSRKWQYLVIGLVALITVAVIVFLLKNQYIPFVGSPSKVVISSPSPTPSPTPVPTPTPIPDIDRSQFKIRVLNGTTTSGLAASVADKLKALGFKIDKVGNNSNQSVAQTTIRVKPNNASLSAQLVRDLTGQFEATIGADLKASDSGDGEVVIGAK